MGALSNDARERVLALLAEDRKIEAIKVYREATGASLAESKGAVEMLEREHPASSSPLADATDPELLERIRDQLRQGQKIGAIKLYREATGLGLAEAKHAVEAIERAMPPSAEGPVKTSSGCSSAASALILASGLVAAILAL